LWLVPHRFNFERKTFGSMVESRLVFVWDFESNLGFVLKHSPAHDHESVNKSLTYYRNRTEQHLKLFSEINFLCTCSIKLQKMHLLASLYLSVHLCTCPLVHLGSSGLVFMKFDIRELVVKIRQ
jgi:hypothetical protein